MSGTLPIILDYRIKEVFFIPLEYFDEKEKVGKRQQHKRKAEKIVKPEPVRSIFEKYLEVKKKQNLRPGTLNQLILLYNNIETFHNTRTDRPFYLSDITADFISDYVWWLKHEAVRFEGHSCKPKSAQTKGLADASIEGRLKYLKTFINFCLKEELLLKNPFDRFEGFKKNAHAIDILTRNELNKLLKVSKSYSTKSYKHFRDYVLLHVLIDCMFKITEALLISPSDIDHVNRTIIIRSENAKSRRNRIVPLSNKTYRLMIHLLEENQAFDEDV